jgi:2-iminobutanoate/2-iminopropanoate deaminase
MKQKALVTDLAPTALGPYSEGIDAGDYVFASGQVGLDPLGKGAEGEAAQSVEAFKKVAAILDAAGCTWTAVAVAERL